MTDTSSHIILLLDKHLHAFPWESIPCLANQNVSRLPSLAALRSCLLTAEATKSLSKSDPSLLGAEGHFVSRSGGHAIVNPSGDLAHTDSTISPLIRSLPGNWTLQHSAPTESQLSQVLPATSIYLYFGHGSGAQYIRPRAVKKLSRCATAWLMGCSSSAVADHGGFEPSGMVLAYLAAGAPAVVGTLWDVTDKDVDRASVKTGELWGLWTAKVQDAKAKKGKKRGGDKDVEMPRRAASRPGRCALPQFDGPADEMNAENVLGKDAKSPKHSLVEAVTKSRDACYLRYLNGAALVVYGIPVYIVD